MKIESGERRYFKLKSATEPGPYIGFTSYQHFDGEKLYSDIVVRPENNMTETEKIESYPLPRDVEQNGRQEGYYPPCSVARLHLPLLQADLPLRRCQYLPA